MGSWVIVVMNQNKLIRSANWATKHMPCYNLLTRKAKLALFKFFPLNSEYTGRQSYRLLRARQLNIVAVRKSTGGVHYLTCAVR
jgi:excinuclease UvrABC nuclease subunit